MLERSIERYVSKKAEELGIPVLKLKLDTNAGYPDRLYLLPAGKPAFIEFKRPGEAPRPLQVHRMNILKALGYDVLCTDNKEEGIKWLKTLHASRLPKAGD